MKTVPQSQNHLAALLGISKSATSRNVSRGMPTSSVESAQAWREAHQSIARRKRPTLDRADQTGRPDPGQGAVESHDAARTRREIAEANLAERRYAEAVGELIRVDAISEVLGKVFSTTRDALLQIPPRIAPTLAADSDPASVQAALHAEIDQALQTLAGAQRAVQTAQI